VRVVGLHEGEDAQQVDPAVQVGDLDVLFSQHEDVACQLGDVVRIPLLEELRVVSRVQAAGIGAQRLVDAAPQGVVAELAGKLLKILFQKGQRDAAHLQGHLAVQPGDHGAGGGGEVDDARYRCGFRFDG